MGGWVQRLHQRVVGAAVGLVLALALLVLHHAALLVERGLGDRAKQVAHAVRFHEQRGVERGGRHVLEVVGAVGIGRAVLVGDADLLERGEELALVVLAGLEHQVLEQVREAAAAAGLVLAANVVPDVDRHDRRLAVGVHDHAQAVGQGELLVRDIHAHRRACRGGLGIGAGQAGREREGKDEEAKARLAQRLGHGAPG